MAGVAADTGRFSLRQYAEPGGHTHPVMEGDHHGDVPVGGDAAVPSRPSAFSGLPGL